jgi:hypothetical protein
MSEQTFRFQPRWKEELVVSADGGSIVLELPMGTLGLSPHRDHEGGMGAAAMASAEA